MKYASVGRKFEDMQQRLVSLLQHTHRSPDLQKRFLEEVLGELSATLEDLQLSQEELRRQNEELAVLCQSLAKERRRYRALFDLAPDGYLVTDPGGIIREANRAAAALLRVRRDFLIGKPLSLYVAAQERKHLYELLNHLPEKEQTGEWKVLMEPCEGPPFPAALTVSTIRDTRPDLSAGSAKGEWAGLRWLVRDITGRKQAEILLTGEKQILEMIASGAPLIDTLDRLCRNIDGQSPALISAVLVLDGDGNHLLPIVAPQVPKDLIRHMTLPAVGPSAGPSRTARRSPDSISVSDIAGDPLWADCRPTALRDGLRAYWSTPIFSTAGKVLGKFAMFCRQLREPRDHEMRLIERATHLAAIAIEHKQGEKALRQSEERFRLLVEGVQDYAVVMLDPEGVVVSWNSGAERIKGYRAEEIIGKHFACFHPAEDIRRGMPQKSLKVAAAEGRFAYEGWRVRKDGSVFWASTVITALRDDFGQLRGFAKITHDITERKRAEEKLREQAALLDLAQEAIIVRDLEDRITYWNAGAERTYGWTTGEATGKVIQALLQTEFPEPLESIKAKLLRDGIWDGELTQTRRDGERIIVDSHWVLQKNRNGRPMATLAISRDITDRKRAETALRQGEQLIHGLFEYAPDAIVVINRDGTMAHLNAQVESMFGYSRNDLLGKPVEVLIPGRFRERHIKYRGNYMAQPRVRSMGAGLELWGRRKDGSEFPLDIMLSPMQSGSLSVVIATVRDITERRRAEDLERKLIISERLVILGELAASLAHEFNNPLGIIMGFAEDLLTELEPSDPQYEALEIIEKETARCKKIMDHLLKFARPSTENFQLTDLNSIISAGVHLVRSHLGKAGVKVDIESPPDLAPIYADPEQLEQVLINLFFNAAEAMPRGGALTIRVETDAAATESDDSSNGVAIAVSDTGIGIAPNNLHKIFQPFFTTKEKRGMGLGLAICERIIRNHGGKITVESQLGKGTTFYIHLPAAEKSCGSDA